MTAVETYLELNHRATARCAGCFPDHTRGLALLLAASRPGGATQKEISQATGAPDYGYQAHEAATEAASGESQT